MEMNDRKFRRFRFVQDEIGYDQADNGKGCDDKNNEN